MATKTLEERIEDIRKKMGYIGHTRTMVKSGYQVKCIGVSELGDKGIFQFIDAPDRKVVIRRFKEFDNLSISYTSEREKEMARRKKHCETLIGYDWPDGSKAVGVTDEGNLLVELPDGRKIPCLWTFYCRHGVTQNDITIYEAFRMIRENEEIRAFTFDNKCDSVIGLPSGTILSVDFGDGRITEAVVFGEYVGFSDNGSALPLKELQNRIDKNLVHAVSKE